MDACGYINVSFSLKQSFFLIQVLISWDDPGPDAGLKIRPRQPREQQTGSTEFLIQHGKQILIFNKKNLY